MKKCLLFICCCLFAWPTFSQLLPGIQPPASRERILLEVAGGHSLAEVNAALAVEKCFLPIDERMQLAGGRQYLAWLSATSPNLPQSDAELYALLERLERHAAISFAHPFVKSPNGAIFGITDVVLVKLKPGQSRKAVDELAALTGARHLRENAFIKGLFHLSLDKHALAGPMDIAVAFRDQFEYVDLDYLLNPIVATNDPFFIHQWSLKNNGTVIQGNGTPGADMDVEAAWNTTTGDPNIRIAIIDSGTDTTHPDLTPNLRGGYDATGGGSKGYPNTNFPNDAHGTNCSGIAAAKGDNNLGIAGVCYDCSLVPVKVFYYVFNPFGDPLPFSRGSDMADAISWSWQVGQADVLSNSWGIMDNLIAVLPDGTAPAENAIALALDSARNGRGALLFFSSGNDGGAPIWPGRLAGCISVNATSMCDQAKTPSSCDGQNWTGNWGDSLDVSAPGVRVAATDMTGSNGYDPSEYYLTFGGTSAACPNAAGVMGLILSVNPDLSRETARYILESTCDKVGNYAYSTSHANGSWSQELGYGRLNAHSAVLAATLSLSTSPSRNPNFDFRAYPNPAIDELHLEFSLPSMATVELELRDLTGKLLFSKNWGELNPISYKQNLKEADIFSRPGFRFLTLNFSGHRITKKILIVK